MNGEVGPGVYVVDPSRISNGGKIFLLKNANETGHGSSHDPCIIILEIHQFKQLNFDSTIIAIIKKN